MNIIVIFSTRLNGVFAARRLHEFCLAFGMAVVMRTWYSSWFHARSVIFLPFFTNLHAYFRKYAALVTGTRTLSRDLAERRRMLLPHSNSYSFRLYHVSFYYSHTLETQNASEPRGPRTRLKRVGGSRPSVARPSDRASLPQIYFFEDIAAQTRRGLAALSRASLLGYLGFTTL